MGESVLNEEEKQAWNWDSLRFIRNELDFYEEAEGAKRVIFLFTPFTFDDPFVIDELRQCFGPGNNGTSSRLRIVNTSSDWANRLIRKLQIDHFSMRFYKGGEPAHTIDYADLLVARGDDAFNKAVKACSVKRRTSHRSVAEIDPHQMTFFPGEEAE